MSARPGGWVNGVGWVAWLFDVENGARCQSSRGKPEANDYEWQHSDINEFSIHDQPVIVTRWADGTVPAAPEVTDPPSDGGRTHYIDSVTLERVPYRDNPAAARPAPSTPAADDHDGHTINLGAPSTVTAATEPTERGDLAKHVGAKIRAAREQAHMTQAQVAERLDCTPTAVSYWESGARHLPPEMVSRMAAALGVTAPDLLPTAWFAPSPSPAPQANPRPSTPADTVRGLADLANDGGTETIPSVDVCGFCWDSECDGIGCIAALDPLDADDHPKIEQLHALLRAGHALRAAAEVTNEPGGDS